MCFFPRCLSKCSSMWKVRASLIAGADWSNAPPVPLARCSTLSTFPKTIFIHCTLSRHSSGTVMSVSSFFSTNIPYKSTRISFEQARKNCPDRINKLEFTYTSGERWCLNPHRLRRLLVFLLARNKDRPTQLVFFLHPPLLVDCIAGTGLNDSVAPPSAVSLTSRIMHSEGCVTVGDERARSRRGGWETDCGRDGKNEFNCAFAPV